MEFQAVDQSRRRILGSDISNSPVIPTSNTPTPMQIFTQPAPTTTATITPSKIASETAVILDFIKSIMEAMIPKDAYKSSTILPSSSSSSNSAFLPLTKNEIGKFSTSFSYSTWNNQAYYFYIRFYVGIFFIKSLTSFFTS